MIKKTRKNNKKHPSKHSLNIKCYMKTCKAKKYHSLYGKDANGGRAPRALFF
jgi:hypothetical protein